MTSGYAPERLRARLRAFRLDRMVRLIHQRHRPNPLGVIPTSSRFSDPDGRYAVLYAAASVRCALWETVVRDRLTRRERRVVPRSEIEDRIVVWLRSREQLALVDLRGDGPVRIGAPTAVTHDANHAAGRALAAATYEALPDADGFLYSSRFTKESCVAVFDRAISRLAVMDTAPLITQAELVDALSDYGITLVSPP